MTFARLVAALGLLVNAVSRVTGFGDRHEGQDIKWRGLS